MNNYRDISEFQSATGVLLPAKEVWRIPPPAYGGIRGIPTLRGSLVATDGILCYLQDGERIMLCHLAAFVPDREWTNTFDDYYGKVAKREKGAPRQPRKKAAHWNLLIELLNETK